jgi:hypothetical protein
MRVEEVSCAESVEMRCSWSGRGVMIDYRLRENGWMRWECKAWHLGCKYGEYIYTLFIHTLFDGIFVVGFGGVLECAAEACRCHFGDSGL